MGDIYRLELLIQQSLVCLYLRYNVLGPGVCGYRCVFAERPLMSLGAAKLTALAYAGSIDARAPLKFAKGSICPQIYTVVKLHI